MSYLSKPVWIKDLETSIEFSVFHIVLTFLVAVFLGFVSSIIPIFKISKIPVKDIILNSIEKKHIKSKIKLLISIVAISMAVVAPQLIPSGQGIVSLIFLTICMIMSIVSIILLVPYLTNIFVKIFERIYFILFHNEGVLAAKNLKDNKSTFTNISLLAIGISSILMINIVSFSVSKEVGNVYSDLNFDIWLTNYHSNRNFEKILNTVDGVESICGVYEINNVEIMNKNSKILVLNGIDKNTYSDFWNIHIEGNENELLKDLDNGRNLLLSKSLKEKFGIEKGGLLELNMKSGIKSYKIIGFFNTLMNNGNYAVISDKYLKADAKLSYYSQFYIKTTKTPTEVTQNIKNRFPRISMYISTMDEMERLNVQSNDQMFTILNGFSVMSLIIGIFGVLNNFILSFIERKRWLAVFRSLGMNKHQIIKMLFIESLTCGLIGGIIGAITGLILVKNVSYILVAINLPVSMHLSPVMFINSILGGMLITFLANISPAIKSSRLNIIDAIKYE